MLKVAITGGVGSGKSTVTRMFQELGAAVLDADQVARSVVEPGQPAWEELRRTWGSEFFHEDGTLDRAQVAHRVFADPEARRQLNAIIHPWIGREIKARLADLERQGVDLVLVEVPLLFEAGLEKAYERVIVVYAKEEDQVRRLQGRDRRETGEVQGMLKSQWPLKDKLARADYTVDNCGSLVSTRRQVKKIWQELQKIILTAGAKKVSVP